MAKNIVTRHPSRKLDQLRFGLFEVLADLQLRAPYAARFRLPDTMRIHPVFQVSLLEHTAGDPFTGQLQPPPSPGELNGEAEYYVDNALGPRALGR